MALHLLNIRAWNGEEPMDFVFTQLMAYRDCTQSKVTALENVHKRVP